MEVHIIEFHPAHLLTHRMLNQNPESWNEVNIVWSFDLISGTLDGM